MAFSFLGPLFLLSRLLATRWCLKVWRRGMMAGAPLTARSGWSLTERHLFGLGSWVCEWPPLQTGIFCLDFVTLYVVFGGGVLRKISFWNL
jgi:hypothetical protein